MFSNLKILLILCFLQNAFTDRKYDEWESQIIFKSQSYENKSGLKKSLNMTVFYESLCSDSITFFKKQFSKNWKPFDEYINIELIPYGKATQTRDEHGNWKFVCQHGEDECYGNRIQACAINRILKERPKKLFAFISCYMSVRNQTKYGSECAHKYNICFQRLKDCAKSTEGFDLLAKLGNRTHNFTPKISWIPTIVFNDTYNEADDKEANNNLKSVLCRKLNNEPKNCK